MYTDGGGSPGDGEGMGGSGRGVSLLGRDRPQNPFQERLAGGADQHRVTGGGKGGHPSAEQVEVMTEVLAESDPGIEADPLPGTPAAMAISTLPSRKSRTSTTTSS